MPDEDGYPTEAELEKIRMWNHPTNNWRPKFDFTGLLDYIRGLWKYDDYFQGPDVNGIYHISTGGWSGNESLMSALEEDVLFWMMCWQKSERGGHYEFEVRPITRSEATE